ncbi:Metallo-dependent phosphatase-like protein [Haematococcus lacustris]
MDSEPSRPLPVPKPRPFPSNGVAPGPRCGHTLTAIAGPEGDLSKARLVLFGGATALEGSGSSAKGAETPPSPGPAAASGIRLAGATNDVHIFDVRNGKWDKITPLGEPPSPRAAHAAAAVGNMVVIQGGIGPAGLATEDLHVLDFTDPERPRWHRVLVQGAGPSARYAHTLSLVANRFLVAMGGNDGKSTLGDAWALDTSEKPYQWRKIVDAGEMPSPRMYATAAARGDGLLLLCGGRDAGGTPMGDAYGFARHRDGRWEWHAAPGAMPTGRYQHGAIFVGNRLHISGGAVGGGRMVDEATATVVLDTNAGQWVSPVVASPAGEDFTRRCRHAVSSVGPFVFIYGGLKGSQLLDDLLVADDSNGAELSIFDPRAAAWVQWMGAMHGNAAAAMLAKAASEEAAAALSLGRVSMEELRSGEDSGSTGAPDMTAAAASQRLSESPNRADSPDVTLSKPYLPSQNLMTPDVRLWHRAVVVHQENSLRGMVRQLSIDQLDNEGRRVGVYEKTADKSPLFTRSLSAPQGIHKRVINELLRPRTWKAPEDRRFFLSAADICELCDACTLIFREERTVLELHAPIKIFGDLHGQFGDLMRLFEEYGTPSTAGDITYIDYLFLGDYVDRGSHSLETICLLLALKIEHPRSVHLIRGNHEAHDINALFGFRLECMERLGDDQGVYVWRRINELFNYLPLAASIEGKILCMHGGIGRSIHKIEQIASIPRPVTMEDGGPVLMDLLWSDPTTNDGVQGVQPSPRGPGLVTFGPDRVKDFCKNNGLQMIVRAHECVMDGFERFAQGHLITLFSATNYCGTAGNAGAILVLGRDLVMVPKLIHPLPPSTPRTPDSTGAIDEDPPVGGHGSDMHWMQAINEERPPTPPRGRPHVPGSSLEYF